MTTPGRYPLIIGVTLHHCSNSLSIRFHNSCVTAMSLLDSEFPLSLPYWLDAIFDLSDMAGLSRESQGCWQHMFFMGLFKSPETMYFFRRGGGERNTMFSSHPEHIFSTSLMFKRGITLFAYAGERRPMSRKKVFMLTEIFLIPKTEQSNPPG